MIIVGAKTALTLSMPLVRSPRSCDTHRVVSVSVLLARGGTFSVETNCLSLVSRTPAFPLFAFAWVLSCSSGGDSASTQTSGDGKVSTKGGLACIDGRVYYRGEEFVHCNQCEEPSSCTIRSDTFGGVINVQCAGEIISVVDGRCAEGQCDPDLPCPDPGQECTRDPSGWLRCQPTGGLGEACSSEGTCNADLSCLDARCLPAGEQNAPCREDGGCNQGLVCRAGSNSCEIYQDISGRSYGGDECCVPALGAPCSASDPCEEGMYCVTADRCNEYSQCCQPAGGVGESCLPNGSCDPGNACDMESRLCAPAGGARQDCLPDASCNDGFTCFDISTEATIITERIRGLCPDLEKPCCVPLAGKGESCESALCSRELECVERLNWSCIESGGLGELCRENNRCDAGLACVTCGNGECCQPEGA